MNQLCRGKRTPPLDRIESWSDVLKLVGAEREQFFIEAHLAHCPPVIAAGWRKLEARVAELETQQRPLAADRRDDYDPA